MKNIFSLVIVWAGMAGFTFAQPCDLDVLFKQPGNWIIAKPGTVTGVSSDDLTRQKLIINSITQSVQKKYSPKGMDIEVSSSFLATSRLPLTISGGNYYTADWMLVKHDCPYNKVAILQKISEARDYYMVRLHINDFAFTFSYTLFVPENPNQENPWADAFALIDDQPVKDGVAWYWKAGGGRNNNNEHYWLIAQDDKLPFSYVSKKEFAEQLKEYYQKKIKEAELNYAGNLKKTEATYQKLKSINATEANKFKEQSTLQYKKEQEMNTAQYSKNMATIDKILLLDSKILSEPAIIDRIKGYFDFQGFVDAEHIYSSWVIIPNPMYFNSKLPKSSPQFMVLYCDTRDESIFKVGREELIKAIDFTTLKGMLGK
jgi:hypothetical protein